MYECIEQLTQFCDEHGYEIISCYGKELVVKANSDYWKVVALNDTQCSLLHLSTRGKMTWHQQGKSRCYGVKYIMNCIQYHNTYVKDFKTKKKGLWA